jgi:hypothetical protein
MKAVFTLGLLVFLAVVIGVVVIACQSGADDDNDDDNDNGDDDSADDDSTPPTDDDQDDDGTFDGSNVVDSGCLTKSGKAEDDGSFTEYFRLHWDGDGALSIYHGQVCNNCAFDLHVTYTIQDDSLAIMESPDPDFQAVACACLFEYTYDLAEVPAGDYHVTLSNQLFNNDPYNGPWLLFEEDISLPAGESADFEFSEDHEAGCG